MRSSNPREGGVSFVPRLFLEKVLRSMTDDELDKEYRLKRSDIPKYVENLTDIEAAIEAACDVPRVYNSVFKDDKEYTVGPYSFLGKAANELWVQEVIHVGLCVEEMWGEGVLKAMREHYGAPECLTKIYPGCPDYHRSVDRFIEVKTFNLMVALTAMSFFSKGHMIPMFKEYITVEQLQYEVVCTVLFEDIMERGETEVQVFKNIEEARGQL